MTTTSKNNKTEPNSTISPSYHQKGSTNSAKIAIAQFVNVVETTFPLVLVSSAPLIIFFISSLLNLWTGLPLWIHWFSLLATIGATGLTAWWFSRNIQWPTRQTALRRLERDGEIPHEALQALEDTPFQNKTNPLWEAHQSNMRELAARAKLTRPASRSETVDPLGLRYPIVGLFAVAIIIAGNQSMNRLVAGLSPADIRSGSKQLVDIWVEPPVYTGKAPIHLLHAGEKVTGLRDQVNIFQGSVVYMQTQTPNARLRFNTQQSTLKAIKADEGNTKRRQLEIGESGVLIFEDKGRKTRWPIGVIEDREPSIRFINDPSTSDEGGLTISVAIDDDYGITASMLKIKLDPSQKRPLDAPAFDASSLSETRSIPLDNITGRVGERTFDINLQADRWAGLQVIGKLIVFDAAEQKASTQEVVFSIPERAFFNPLAKAVIEQRQTLSVAPSQWRRAEWAFNGLTLGPGQFFEKSSEYLLLRTAMWRVSKRGNENQSDTANDLWPLALQLEDEALELARRRLEAAEEALRNALENGASDEEIEKLTEELRTAMQNYLQQLAQSGQQAPADGPPADETFDQSDLDRMLNSVRDLAKSGAQNAARQALQELENILNNLQMSGRGQQGQGQPGQQGQSGQGQGQTGDTGAGGATGQAGDLIGRQRDLANRSFQRGQQGNNPGSTPGSSFADEQNQLSSELQKLLQDLNSPNSGPGGANGPADPDGTATRALQEALGDMRQAEDALKNNGFRAAGTEMEQAIASLREGAEALAQAAGEKRAQANGQGQESGGSGPGRDPLGRPIGEGSGDGVEVPGISDAERAREILEELRRRLSDGERSEEEIDYLERLIERF